MSYNYDGHARSLRPNPTGSDQAHSGSSFSEQGRTTFPPLAIAFPTSDSPVSGSYPSHYPSQQYYTPVPYEPHYSASAQQHPHIGYPGYAVPTYQQLSDARYVTSSGRAYIPPRASPPGATDLRRLPSLSVPRDDRWPNAHWHYASPWHADMQMSGAVNNMRSPHVGYSSALLSYPQYLQYQSLAVTTYSSGRSPSGGAVPTAAAANTHYHHPMRQSERTTTVDPQLLQRLSGAPVTDPAPPILGSEMQNLKEPGLPAAACYAPPTTHELTPKSTQEMQGMGSMDVQPALGLAISPKCQLAEIPGKQELKRHVFERHDPGKPLECPFCANFKWKRSNAIKKHILTVHKDHLKMDELEEISALRGFSQTLEYLGKPRRASNP
ncbi:hypothetical protein BC834DRAFT_974435 [Gloeopeniophorella convolvens]|nr:hypothetical protein BC834DRAFT_974435 [Gloeopeniophorella convolvens]